jgi:hypothetical protein
MVENLEIIGVLDLQIRTPMHIRILEKTVRLILETQRSIGR